MIPKPPPREPSQGFLYLPPFRLYGESVAGETTAMIIPELDLGFDIGSCPRAMLPSKHLAITHGHMDHIGGLAYYCSQRRFQGMGTAKIVCDARIAPAIKRMMEGYVDLERQRTPYELIPLLPNQPLEIKNNILLRGFETEHTCPSFGYVASEKRTKLKPEFVDMPQEKLKELKDRGVEITRSLEIPLIAFTGDTAPGPHLIREDVRKAQIVIAECTFFEPDHKERAKVGMHMHLDDIAEWLRILECQHLVLVHVSRRTDMQYARERIAQVAGAKNMERVLFLMDYRTNKARYEGQMVAAGMSLEKPMGRSGPRPTRGPAPARGPGATGASPITPVTPIVQVPPASQPADRDDE
jgi:ribonuclease Z